MAPLIARSIVAVVLAVGMATSLVTVGRAQDGTPDSTPTKPPTCSDRFPAEGPAGIDLRLGCIVSELVGLYTASNREEPPTLSAYALVMGATVAFGVALFAFAFRLLARRASRRLAPVLPSEWWVCPSCRSVNAIVASRCYACGSPPANGPTMGTDPDPTTPQSLGRPTRR